MRNGRSATVAAIALGWAALVLPGAAFAATGTIQERLLTFSDQPANTNAEIGFMIENTVATSGAVRLWMDFAADGNSSVPPGAEPFVTPANVRFELSYDSAVVWTFTAADAAAIVSQSIPTPPVDATAAKAAVGRYQIILSFPSGSGSLNKTWKLAIKDTGAPLPRGTIYIEDKGHFMTLAPVGPCTVTNSPTCPAGKTCQGPCPLCWPCPLHPCFRKPWIWYCLERIVWIPKWWKFPPGPCLSCPKPWQEKFGDDVERFVVEFVALNKESTPLGEGQAKQIQLDIKSGRAIGPIVDLGASEYAQMVEIRKGAAPAQVTATIAGTTTPPFDAGPEPAPRDRLTSILAILLVLALAFAAYLARRNRAANPRA
jgi:hypothetical protein